MWPLNFITEEDFKNHVKATIEKFSDENILYHCCLTYPSDEKSHYQQSLPKTNDKQSYQKSI